MFLPASVSGPIRQPSEFRPDRCGGECPVPREPAGDPNKARRAIDAVWRIEAPRLIARLTRLVGDVGIAEDAVQDALVVALERWPDAGIPDRPGAWLAVAAERRAIDVLRRRAWFDRRIDELGRDAALASEGAQAAAASADEAALDVALDAARSPDGTALDDDVLRLIFMTCHPVLSQEARVALTLRLLGGLSTSEIAHAFLVPEPTVAQRLVRAKRTLATARVPFEVPVAGERSARLSSVLEVIYLIFNAGYVATGGDDWMRPALCEEALRLGRALMMLMPRDAETHGLVALMEIQASRMRARLGPGGEPVLLQDQDRTRWDRLLIRRGLDALTRAERLGGPLGPYTLQAEIAACHARARTAEETDWALVAALYNALGQIQPSPVVELNRAVAVAMALGPEAGLRIVDALSAEPALVRYHLLPAVRGDLLLKLGRSAEARAQFERAASLTSNARERTLLLQRAAACPSPAPAPARSAAGLPSAESPRPRAGSECPGP